ncbi:DNA repair protein [Terfezia boudieri ATCC MYA-4762]|uniref:DNA repair protein REV1 n=1 Tax=Terfezia boudieri ATCC MYA-4762 TaxID=1051890 RepID=A0A3N4LF76_9PEZI|nr:DNA repair protein [Terfezia boudieri ATCC MYA-4762]
MSSRLHGSDKNAQVLAKRYADHTFEDEDGEEYGASNFGDFATYMRHKKAKLQNRNALLRSLPENQDKPQILRGVVATVNGYTNPSLQDLTEMVVTHGGIFVQYMDGKTAVTHIIASALTPKKMVEFARYKVVKPAWVVECIKEGRLLSWEQWKVIPEGSRQATLGFTPSQSETPGSPGRVGLVTQRPRRTVGSYKDVITPGRVTPGPAFERMIGRGSVRPSPSVSSSKRPTPVTRSLSSSQSDIPDGRSFAIVIPESRSATPRRESSLKGEEAAEHIAQGEDEVEQEPPATLDCVWVGGKQQAPITQGKTLTEMSPSYQLPSPLLSSPFDEIPPSHQPEPPSGREIPQLHEEVPESSPSEAQFILSFTKSESDEVESLMQTLNNGKGTKADLAASQKTLVDQGESGRSRGVTPRRVTVVKDEIPPTSPNEDIDMGTTIPEGFFEAVATTTNPSSPTEEPETPTKASLSIKLESIRSPTNPTKKRPSPSTTTPTRSLSPPAFKKAKLFSASTEANTTLLDNPRVRSTSALNPDFLKQYYQESRLHHLSAWKSELKQKLQVLTKQASSNNKSPKLKGKAPRRYILHVDFDCFFAAISARNHPSNLTGKPVVVTHGKGGEKNVSSEIASCNYKAREFGVNNGMWMGRALELCPDIVCLPYDFPAYEEASKVFYSVVLGLGVNAVQSVSVDEVLVDATSLCCTAGEGSVDAEQAHADILGTMIRDRVREKTRCEVSVGIGGNILLAKLALRKAKPAGQYHLKPEEVLDFLGGLGLRDLPGVGHSLAGRLSEELKIKTVAQLRDTPLERLRTAVGSKTGEKLWNFAHGIDHAEVGDVPERKSVGVDVSWGVRFETQAQAEEFLHNLAGELHRRLVEANVKARQVTVKIMKRAKDAPIVAPKFLGHGECDVFTKSIGLGMATWDQGILAREAIAVLRAYRFPPVELRGFGLQLTKLEKARVGEESAGGQKTLEFKPAPVPLVVKKENEVPEPAAAVTGPPTKPQPAAGPWAFMPPPPAPRPESSKPDPRSPAGAAASPASSQFLVPSASQIDPSVLDALPSTMRAGILAAAASKNPTPSHTTTLSKPQLTTISPPLPRGKKQFTAPSSAPAAPLVAGPSKQAPQNTSDLIPPSASQIDPDFLASLTPELREEILRDYRSAAAEPPSPLPKGGGVASPRKGKGRKERQTLLLQSPKKVTEWGARSGISSRGSPGRSQPGTSSSPSGARSGSPVSYDVQPRTLFTQYHHHNHPTLKGPTATITYTPIPRHPPTAPSSALAPHPPLQPKKPKLPLNFPSDLDHTVLVSLPPDILSEVLSNHRTTKPPLPKPHVTLPTPPPNPLHPPPSTRCLLLPQPPRPLKSPHLQHLSTLPQLRELISSWVQEDRNTDGDGDRGFEGPNEEDVDILVRYLRDVVVLERDMGKAKAVVEWFGEVVAEAGEETVLGRKENEVGIRIGEGLREWRRAVVRAAEKGVGEGCKERGVPEVGFEFPWEMKE